MLRKRGKLMLHLQYPHDSGIELYPLQPAGVSLVAGSKELERRLVLVVVEIGEPKRVLCPGSVVVAAGQLLHARLALCKPAAAACV
jgi:hypothetical protein